MKKLIVLICAILVCALTFSACSSGTKETTKSEETTAATQAASETTAAASGVDEEGAKAVAFEDAGIKETAAENLSVTEGVKKGEAVYTITFKWSGFEYEYSISKATGAIVESIFDGEVRK